MRRDNRQLAHYGIPILFLLAVTVFVLILRGGLTGGTQAADPSTQTKQTTTSQATTSQPPGKVSIYTVRSGDTLGAIAIHFGVTVDDIMALNPGVEPTALHVGQKIKVRAGKAPAKP
ncbi:MAG TPA: LysM domain-containing protein [Gaiellaceae bacterium]